MILSAAKDNLGYLPEEVLREFEQWDFNLTAEDENLVTRSEIIN